MSLSDFYKPERNTKTATVALGGNGDFIEIRPSDYKPFTAERSRVNKKYKVQIRNGRLDPKVAQREMAPLVAKHLIIDWQLTCDESDVKAIKGLKTAKRKGLAAGKYDVPFSIENAALILSTPSYDSFLNYVVELCAEEATFVAEELEDDIKN